MGQATQHVGTAKKPRRWLRALGFTSLALALKIAGLLRQLSGTELDEITFITVPWDVYEPNPARLVWSDDAAELWRKVRFDQPLSKRLTGEALSAAGDSEQPSSSQAPDGDEATAGNDNSVGPSQETDAEVRREAERRALTARVNGLCA